MGSRLGPNYACLFVGYVEERMLAENTGRKPDLYKRYMDDVAGAASGSEQDLQQCLDFASKYHPKHVYTWSISSDKLPFLDIFMTPCDDRLSTSIYYKDTDSHSYLNFGSSHPSKCKLSIPHTQFLRLRKICSEDDVFQSEATTMETFFAARGYPHDLISRARLRAEERQRADLLVTSHGSNCTAADRSPLVITYYPKNIAVCNILLRNYTSLQDDDSIKVTFDKPPLKAFRRAKNLKDLLVHSSLPQVLQRQKGTFPCNRRDCRTCPFINSSDRITTTQGQIKISGFFTCISGQLIYCISCRKCPGVVYIGETGRRLGDRFREHRLDVIKKKVALPVPAHFMGMATSWRTCKYP